MPVFGAFERMFHGVHRGHDLNVHARGVVLLQIAIDFFNQLRVVWPVLVQPEDHGRGGRLAPIHGQFHPILNGNVLDRTRAEDIALFHVPFVQDVTGSVNHADGSLARGFVGLVVRAIFLSLLSHQPDVGHAAHRGGIEFPVLSTEINDGLINARVTAVRDHGFHVVFFAVRPPHFPTHAKGRGHGGVNNDVARHVEVGDAFVRIHHGETRPLVHRGLNVGLDCFLLRGRQSADFGIHVTQAVIRIDAKLGKRLGVFLKDVVKVDGDAVTENDGVGNLHHGGLHVQRQQNAALFGVFDLLLEKLA